MFPCGATGKQIVRTSGGRPVFVDKHFLPVALCRGTLWAIGSAWPSCCTAFWDAGQEPTAQSVPVYRATWKECGDAAESPVVTEDFFLNAVWRRLF